MMCSQTLGQLIKATNKPKNVERLKAYKIDPREFDEDEPEPVPVKPVAASIIVDRMRDAMFPLMDGDTVGVRVKPGQYYGYVQKYAHLWAERNGMRVTTGHRNGIVWIKKLEG
jgi:hypothetical protein